MQCVVIRTPFTLDPSTAKIVRSKCLGTWRRWFGFSVHSAVVYQRIRLQPQRLKQHLMLPLGRDLGCRCITFFFLGIGTHIYFMHYLYFCKFRLVICGDFDPHTFIQTFFFLYKFRTSISIIEVPTTETRLSLWIIWFLNAFLHKFQVFSSILRRITTLDSPRFQPSYHRFISSIQLFHRGKLYCGLRSIADLMSAFFLFDKLVENKLLFSRW